jgi:hypothetical protein
MKYPKLSKEQRAYFEWEHKNSHAAMTVEVMGPYVLHIIFDDDTESTIDFEHALRTFYNAGMYAPLLDPDYFARVEIQHGHLTWPNGIDFNPAYLYKWDEHLAMMASSPSGTKEAEAH